VRTAAPAAIERTLAAQDWSSLLPHLDRARVDDPARAIEQLRLYARQLLEWNRSVSNLIAAGDEPRIVERHIRESIEPAWWLKESGASRWLDFGAGAGLPGIPLAIAGVGAHWTMVESRRPKTLFMRKTLITLALSNIDVVHGRLEAIIDERSGKPGFDGFVSRATLRLPETLELAESIVEQGGYAFVWKGSRRNQELEGAEGWTRSWSQEGSLDLRDSPVSVMKFVRK
jgi:16S rRNA (guanine527-N7)-methyltransferase